MNAESPRNVLSFREGCEECVLGRVGGFLRVPQYPEAEVVDPSAVTLDEDLEGVGAALLETPDELFVRVGGIHRFERYREGGPAVSVTTTTTNFSVHGIALRDQRVGEFPQFHRHEAGRPFDAATSAGQLRGRFLRDHDGDPLTGFTDVVILLVQTGAPSLAASAPTSDSL